MSKIVDTISKQFNDYLISEIESISDIYDDLQSKIVASKKELFDNHGLIKQQEKLILGNEMQINQQISLINIHDKQIRQFEKELSGLQAETKILKDSIDKDTILCQNIRKDIEKEQQKLDSIMGKIIPDINLINSEKARLTQKEKDLNVIIKRYEKRYAEKGAGFKI
jgi:predicted  nucleic acid-binding Zn-ribbon protein